jgi:hypothetical protein
VVSATDQQTHFKILVGQNLSRPDRVEVTTRIDIKEGDIDVLSNMEGDPAKNMAFDIGFNLVHMNLTFSAFPSSEICKHLSQILY